MIQNRSALNFIVDWADSMHIDSNTLQLQFSSIGFDASIPEIFAPLISGASIQLVPQNIIEDIGKISDFIIDKKITSILFPPSVLINIPYIKSKYLKSVLAGGEKCSWEIVKKWSKDYTFVNAYGPTEASVGCTWGYYKAEMPTKSVPIGIPIYNVKVYVLDKSLYPVPFGVPGELYVGEDALARGYIGKPDLTALKFIPNKYSNKPGERIYRTGDIVKVLQDGQLEFLGRIDNQVKLRGFRIELEEIETIIRNFSKKVTSVAAVLHENNNVENLRIEKK